ncbi:MAG: S-layer homology domain-containing protein [Oscillospiraceae bacterium]|nr:S-layer homology domain-containing protein [Oscillospiraceae bacterium]
MKHTLRRFCAALCALALCLTPVSALSVEQALTLLENHYVDPLPDAAYRASTLDELFSAVGDPYTYYMTAVDYEEFSAGVEQESSVTGIGAAIEYTANGIRITSVLDGGGAKDAGLQGDDYIIAVDGVSCVPAAEAHRSLIIGEEGTFVTLTIRHADGSVRDYRIERRSVALHNTVVTVANGVGTVDCNSFGSQTSAYFEEGVAAHDGDVEHWVVDLRGNLGGLADAAVGALGVFTGSGNKLFYRLNDGSSFYTTYLADALTDKPVIVLVDGSSASASEIFSGGVRAEEAGIVVGSRTYGKGTAQNVLDETRYPELFDGDSLKVTTYRFYCADGNTTDRLGVIPTLLVDDACADAVAALLRAEAPKSGEYLSFPLNGHVFYVDLSAAGEISAALSALFAALPPDLTVSRVSGGKVVSRLDPADTAKGLGIDYVDRRFTDLADSACSAQINTLGVYGILAGDGKGHFRPDAMLTRAELAALLAQALNVSVSGSERFADVTGERWYSGSVNAVTYLGFMNGVSPRYFNPDGTLTQEQFIAVMGRLARFLNFHADDYARERTVPPDFDALAPWARVEASVLTEYDGNMLYAALDAIDPHAPVTREQAAATLCNMFKTLNLLSY